MLPVRLRFVTVRHALCAVVATSVSWISGLILIGPCRVVLTSSCMFTLHGCGNLGQLPLNIKLRNAVLRIDIIAYRDAVH